MSRVCLFGALALMGMLLYNEIYHGAYNLSQMALIFPDSFILVPVLDYALSA